MIETLLFITGQVFHCHVGELNNGRALFSNGIRVSAYVPIETPIYYVCNQGFTIQGYNLSQCDRYGKWNTSMPTCEGNNLNTSYCYCMAHKCWPVHL